MTHDDGDGRRFTWIARDGERLHVTLSDSDDGVNAR
jgi:hypothetical protein